MIPTEQLLIKGYKDQPVPNGFYRQKTGTDHLSIILPGRGYTSEMPLLYYPANLLVSKGIDVLRVDANYLANDEFQSLEMNEQFRWLFADVAATCQTGMAQRDYRHITLVGKSLGTLAMGHLLTSEKLPAQVNAIWLTPLVRFDFLRDQIKAFGGHSLFVIGTADPHYDAESLAEVQQATGGDVVTIADANHGMDIEGDVLGSVAALKQIMQGINTFLG